jgi:hypothetical protein
MWAGRQSKYCLNNLTHQEASKDSVFVIVYDINIFARPWLQVVVVFMDSHVVADSTPPIATIKSRKVQPG